MAIWAKFAGCPTAVHSSHLRGSQSEQTNPMVFWVEFVGYLLVTLGSRWQSEQTNPMALWANLADYSGLTDGCRSLARNSETKPFRLLRMERRSTQRASTHNDGMRQPC
jgi:hypothetical protein